MGWWFAVRFCGSFLRRFFRDLGFIDVVAWASEAPKKGTVKLCIFFIFRVWVVTLFIFTIHFACWTEGGCFSLFRVMSNEMFDHHAYWDSVDFRSHPHHRHRRHHKIIILNLLIIIILIISIFLNQLFPFFSQPNHEPSTPRSAIQCPATTTLVDSQASTVEELQSINVIFLFGIIHSKYIQGNFFF